jgi:serine phosphatase RsbU (regulator of sigma subunit)/Tfp pilus assembly protein PilF
MTKSFSIFLICILCVSHVVRAAYTPEIDSLIAEVNKSKADTNKVNTLYLLSDRLWKKSYLDTATICATDGLELARKLKFYRGESALLSLIGILHAVQGEYPKAIEYMQNALTVAEKIKDQSKIASCLNNLGNIYEKQGDYTNALACHIKSLKIKEELGDVKATASSYNNIGIIHKHQKNYTEALHYYGKALDICAENNELLGVSQAYSNIGTIYQTLGELCGNKDSVEHRLNYFKKSLEFAYKGLEIKEELIDNNGRATSLNNIGSVYYFMGDLEKALEAHTEALKIRTSINDRAGVASSLYNLGVVYLRMNKVKEAHKYQQQSLQMALEIGAKEKIRGAYLGLSQADSALGNYKEAYTHYKLFVAYRDSLVNEENTRLSLQLEMKYEFDKKTAQDSLNNAKAQELKDAEIARQDAELSVQRNQQYALFGGLFLVVIFAGVMYNRFKITNKQNRIISRQKELVEEKQKEILDSIKYAKRIQHAILPPKKRVNSLLPNSFIVYKPKDIVAGDFYWLEEKNGSILFAAADCTGHGVPGAMVSVVCNNGLNRSVREHGITDPGQILDKTREIVIQEFDKSEEDVKDGMDISLVALQQTQTLQWAGANNPLWIARKNEMGIVEMLEIKPNKQAIGKVENPIQFTTHQVSLQSDDTIYLFTDGYADQFGGPKGKKFMYKAFKELLLSVHSLSMEEQKIKLEEVFETWKGENEQIDDVCVIGVRIQ